MAENENNFENNVENISDSTESVSVSGKAEEKKSVKKTEPKKKAGAGQKLSRWFREMRSELKKVVWPTPKATVSNSGIVIGMILIVGIFVWVFDWLMKTGVWWVIGKFGQTGI